MPKLLSLSAGIFFIITFLSCKQYNNENGKKKILVKDYSIVKKIFIQPLGNVQEDYLQTVASAVKEFYGYEVVIRPRVEFSKDMIG